ncbi:MAG: Bro-N domain-containing protein [Candidatus Kerfeldbacteria bacterium]|nr:Bro-N domain-containing protein [Candidatus Kerfeldbacteria bacterium]
MTKKEEDAKFIVLFEHVPVRRVWVEKEEKWYFSVVDVIRVLTESADARNYWKVLKNRLKEEGSEVVTKCNQLKMHAEDGKMRFTDAADVESVFRIIQSIPSKNAEPFKQWLAKVGYERMQETVDPERALNRARRHWKELGRSKKWIEQRMLGQETRNKLTDYWSEHGIEQPVDYAKLTDLIHKEWSELTTAEHKKLKHLQSQNLRDHMTDAELIFTALAELSTRQIAETENAEGFQENVHSAKEGGAIAGNARKQLEAKTGKKIVSKSNFLLMEEKRKRLKK